MTSCCVYKGGATPGETESEAAHYLAEMAEKYAGELEILVTGSVTNHLWSLETQPCVFSSGEEYRIDGRNNRTADLCKAGNG